MIARLARTEPVRLYVYGLTVPALALAVAYGLVSAELVPLWTALAVALLAVPGVERARSVVTSPATLEASSTGGDVDLEP